MVFLISITAHAALYEWTDDKGVVYFTDNPANIPAKYMKRVKKRPSINIDTTGSVPAPAQEVKQKPPTAGEASPIENEVLYGGHNEEWWRSAFGNIRDELKSIQDKLPDKKRDLEAARRTLTVYTFPQNRIAYVDLLSEIEKDEARIHDLNNQLESLDNDASRASVPFDWRK